MSKKITNSPSIDAPVFAYTNEKESIELLASMKIESSAPPKTFVFVVNLLANLVVEELYAMKRNQKVRNIYLSLAFICKIEH